MPVLILFALAVYLKNISLKVTLWIASKYLAFPIRSVLICHIIDIVYSVSQTKWTNIFCLSSLGWNSPELVMLGSLFAQIKAVPEYDTWPLKQISNRSGNTHLTESAFLLYLQRDHRVSSLDVDVHIVEVRSHMREIPLWMGTNLITFIVESAVKIFCQKLYCPYKLDVVEMWTTL